jgi:hypothetical protein
LLLSVPRAIFFSFTGVPIARRRPPLLTRFPSNRKGEARCWVGKAVPQGSRVREAVIREMQQVVVEELRSALMAAGDGSREERAVAEEFIALVQAAQERAREKMMVKLKLMA